VTYQVNKKSFFCAAALGLLLAIFSNFAFAASKTLRLEEDSNSRIVVENAIINGNETSIFFWTWPYMGDPNAGKPCPLNFYSLTLRPGLPSVQPQTIAKGICGGITAEGGILENGDALIMVRDRLERWRGGEKISSDLFSAIGATSKLRVSTDNAGSQFFDISPAGDIVMAIPVGGYIAKDFPDSKLILASLKHGDEERWQLQLSDVGDYYTINNIWAAQDGGALLYISPTSVDPKLAVSERQLRFISTSGTQSPFMLTEAEAPFDVASMRPGSQEDLQKFFESQKNAKPESIKMLSARPREGGGFDVLFHRKGGVKGRAGHFLYRIAADGSLQSETVLGGHLEDYGLEKWTDFNVSDGQLILLSRVMATQHGVQSRRTKWMQNTVSWVDLDSGMPVSRLIPLDQRYLEAAMNSGDEGRQYLEGQPGGEPVMLTSLGGVPLSVGLGWLKGRNTLRLNEATEDLVAFTEVYDERQAKIAKEKARQQRKVDRDAARQGMNADLAATVGMSPEDFAALSNKERKEKMIREGDPNAMMAAIMKQAQSAQQSMAASGATPDQLAQMEAAMAQAQQLMQGAGAGMPGTATTPAPATVQSAKPAAVLTVDALMRGHIQYKNEAGKAATMSVINRQTGDELLKKEYADGVINEYISLGRYKLPLEQIGVIIRNVSGEVLEDLTPKASTVERG
jgi:hypothetical protein